MDAFPVKRSSLFKWKKKLKQGNGLRNLHLVHYHTYPKTPQMNVHLERFNRTIQDEFIDFHTYLLINPDEFNLELIDYLLFYNNERVYHAFQNKLSPLQFMMNWQKSSMVFKLPAESRIGLHYTYISF